MKLFQFLKLTSRINYDVCTSTWHTRHLKMQVPVCSPCKYQGKCELYLMVQSVPRSKQAVPELWKHSVTAAHGNNRCLYCKHTLCAERTGYGWWMWWYTKLPLAPVTRDRSDTRPDTHCHRHHHGSTLPSQVMTPLDRLVPFYRCS
jgi:hypothetical protein